MGATTLAILTAGALLLGALPAAAEEAAYAVGERIPPLELDDQHGERHAVDESVKLVLFSRDMDGGDVLREAVGDQTAESLAALGAAYVADIHRMPGLVARFIAIPRMRDRPYPVLLDRDGSATARLPDAEGQATILELDRLTLRAVHHLATVEALRVQLGLEPAAGEAAAE